MHKIHIPPKILERARLQRGGRSEPLLPDLRKTAHLIVDMQSGFLEVGAPIEVPLARGIVDNINRISTVVREGGGQNVFLRYTYDPSEAQTWTRWYQRFCGAEGAQASKAAFAHGARYHQLWPGLQVQADEDWVVDKTRFSPFTPGTCDLQQRLKARDIDTIIITGTLTNCCSESAARDAHQLNYDVLFVADANATLSDEEHNATLTNLCLNFADLVFTDTLVPALQVSQATAQA